jgi:hypothetical protein
VEEMDVGMVRRRRTPEARRSNGAVGRHARGGEKMDGGTGTREGEEEDKDARGGGVFFLQSDGRRFSAKWSRNRNFVFLVE